jgi:heme exporter protein D
MRGRFLALAGLLLGLLILVVATFTAHTAALQGFRDADAQARRQDKSVASNSLQSCANPQVRVSVPTRVLLEGEAETITIRVTNTDRVECDLTLSLVAPAFTLQPADNQRLIQLTATASEELTWSVRPTTTGTATLAVTTGNASEQLGVSVLGGNGFVPPQRATANYLSILFGALLAVASLLWWITLLTRQANNAGTARTAPASAPPTTPPPAPPAP